MGYSVHYSSFCSYYEQGEYTFRWPVELTENSCEYLKDILYKNNELILKVCEFDDCAKYLVDNTYFYIFEEGAVLFRLGESTNDTCIGVNLIGMYLSTEYIMTGWFQIDKLIVFLHSMEWSVECKEKVITGEELDDIWEKVNRRNGIMINPDGETTPYSFAVSFVDPIVAGVKYFPIDLAQNMINVANKSAKLVSLDTIFNNKNIFTDSNAGEYFEFIIERNIREKQSVSLKDLLKKESKNKPFFYTWSMKKLGVGSDENIQNGEISKEIKCLEDEQEVNFEKLVRGANKMKNKMFDFDEGGMGCV